MACVFYVVIVLFVVGFFVGGLFVYCCFWGVFSFWGGGWVLGFFLFFVFSWVFKGSLI